MAYFTGGGSGVQRSKSLARRCASGKGPAGGGPSQLGPACQQAPRLPVGSDWTYHLGGLQSVELRAIVSARNRASCQEGPAPPEGGQPGTGVSLPRPSYLSPPSQKPPNADSVQRPHSTCPQHAGCWAMVGDRAVLPSIDTCLTQPPAAPMGWGLAAPVVTCSLRRLSSSPVSTGAPEVTPRNAAWDPPLRPALGTDLRWCFPPSPRSIHSQPPSQGTRSALLHREGAQRSHPCSVA